MKSRIFAASLCTALLLVLLPGAAQAKGRTSKPLPTKRQWYAQVNKAMKPAVPHLRARAIRGGKLAINLDIEPAEKPETVLWIDPTHPSGGV